MEALNPGLPDYNTSALSHSATLPPRHINLFTRAVVCLHDMIAHQLIQVSKCISLNRPKKVLSVGKAKFKCSDCISVREVLSSSPRSRYAGFVFQCELSEFVLKTEQDFLAVASTKLFSLVSGAQPSSSSIVDM